MSNASVVAVLNLSQAQIALAPNTRIGYENDWKLFTAFCRQRKMKPLPASPELARDYLVQLIVGGRSVRTARRHAATLNHVHQAADFPPPVGPDTRRLLAACKRALGAAETQKNAVTLEQLHAIVALCPTHTARGVRDRALLLFGFASALRRGNLVALDLADIWIGEPGISVSIRAEKQDRQGDGRLVAVARGKTPATCPVAAVERWLELRGGEPGPLFTKISGSGRGRPSLKRLRSSVVAYIVQRGAGGIGLDPTAYGGHSLRAGMITHCINAGMSDLLIAQHTGHRELESLKIYHRRSADPFKGNVTAMVGL